MTQPTRFPAFSRRQLDWAKQDAERALSRCDWIAAELEAAVVSRGTAADSQSLAAYRRQLIQEWGHQARVVEQALGLLRDLGPVVGTTPAAEALHEWADQVRTRWQHLEETLQQPVEVSA